MRKKSDPDDVPRLPVKLDPVSNGELVPRPQSPRLAWVQRVALERATEAARSLGVSRREFLRSSCGAATVFLALNQLGGCGGRYRVPREAQHDRAAADRALKGDELIFDVQTHHVSADRPWYAGERETIASFLRGLPQARCGEPRWVECFTRDIFIKEIFFDSDTRMAVLSALWGDAKTNPLHAEEAALTRERMAIMKGAPRLRIHGIVLPNAHEFPPPHEHMQALAETWRVAAWKLYPVWGPRGRGYRLDDPKLGLPTIARGIELGIPLFAVHKGLPLPGYDPRYTRADDVGRVARIFPNVTFLIYHSGWEPDVREGPYDPNATRGVDVLIRSLEENGIGPQGNVYAELGSLWRGVMGDPDQAAHVLGKLLKYLGEDRILWGTDSIWYGSPQDQIQALRAFEITEELQERHGYPALTPERKAKIFGSNALRAYGVDASEAGQALGQDQVTRARQEYLNDPEPSHRTYGPRTRRELLALLRHNRGLPG